MVHMPKHSMYGVFIYSHLPSHWVKCWCMLPTWIVWDMIVAKLVGQSHHLPANNDLQF